MNPDDGLYYYLVSVDGYGGREYTYSHTSAIQPGTRVRVPVSKSRSGRTSEGTVKRRASGDYGPDTETIAAVINSLDSYTTAELEAEIQRRQEVQTAAEFGVSPEQYRSLRDHFLAKA